MPVSASLWAASTAVRIASLDLCADEYLLLFARREQIVSVSRVVADRADSPLWRVARGIPANRGRIEDLISRRPTFLITSGGGGKSTAAIAASLGVKTLTLPYPTTVDAVAANVASVVALTGRSVAADRWNARLSRLRSVSPPLKDAAFLGQGGQTIRPHSLSAQWMQLAGYRQIPVPDGKLTLERLAISPPPIVLKSDYRHAQMSRGRQWLDHPLLARGMFKTIWTDGRPWTCAGPLMPYEIERLRGLR